MGENSFWYRPTRVVPDQRPLNGRVCVCVLSNFPGGNAGGGACGLVTALLRMFHLSVYNYHGCQHVCVTVCYAVDNKVSG